MDKIVTKGIQTATIFALQIATMKVSAICRKDQPDKNGLCKIYVRINERESRKYIPTELKVLATQFDKGKIVKHPQAALLNTQLDAILLNYKKNPEVNRQTLKSFTEHFMNTCREQQLKIEDTIEFYNSQLNKFLEFNGDIQLSKINEQVLKDYNAYLIKRGNENNTRWNSFKFLRKMLNEAGIEPNPVSKWKDRPRYKDNPKTYLTQSEIKKIIKAVDKTPDDNPLKKIGQWFLLQCHIGVSVSDLRKLDHKRFLEGKRLVTNRKKTGELTTVPITKDISHLLKVAGPLSISDQDYNRGLKLLAALAGIEKNISSHVARHTFGVRLAELGVSTEVIAKLMGHKKLATTAIYTQIQNKRVDSEFKGFRY